MAVYYLNKKTHYHPYGKNLELITSEDLCTLQLSWSQMMEKSREL